LENPLRIAFSVSAIQAYNSRIKGVENSNLVYSKCHCHFKVQRSKVKITKLQ